MAQHVHNAGETMHPLIALLFLLLGLALGAFVTYRIHVRWVLPPNDETEAYLRSLARVPVPVEPRRRARARPGPMPELSRSLWAPQPLHGLVESPRLAADPAEVPSASLSEVSTDSTSTAPVRYEDVAR